MTKRIFLIIYIAALVIIPLVLFFLPADFFDSGTSICPSKRFLNISCPGCGMTRAVQHLIHLDFKSAWEFNKLVFIIFPLLSFLYVRYIIDLYKKVKSKPTESKDVK